MRISRGTPEARSRLCVCRASFLMTFATGRVPHSGPQQFCFLFCALITFVPVDIIFGFVCSLGQSIVLNFCWTLLILLMGVYVYVSIQSHFLLLYISASILDFCSSVEFSFFSLFPFFFLFFSLFSYL